MIEEKLESLKAELVQFASHVEGMIDDSVRGLLEKKKELLDSVIKKKEPQANDLELILDERCTTLIAQYEPRGKNLRTILMVLKMNNDLERMADHAVNIAWCGLNLIQQPPVKSLIDIPRMAKEASGMLRDALQAFVKEDPELAKNVCRRDAIVDGLRNQIWRELITYMTGDPSTIERALQLIKISQNLERIADLSTNIAEDIIFMVEGTVMKHHYKKA